MEASSAINSPHPDAPDDAELFFGSDDEDATEDTSSSEPQVGPTPEAQDALDALREQREAVLDPTPPAESAGPTEPVPATDHSGEEVERVTEAVAEREAEDERPYTPEQEPGNEPDPTTPPAGDTQQGKKSGGTLEREYIVFQRVPLSEKVLKHLLKEIEDGNAPDPRIAYIELHRVVARNDTGAVREAYRKNKSRLNLPATLAAVSSRSFKERTIKPRDPVPREEIQVV